jgi:hypothetical protein
MAQVDEYTMDEYYCEDDSSYPGYQDYAPYEEPDTYDSPAGSVVNGSARGHHGTIPAAKIRSAVMSKEKMADKGYYVVKRKNPASSYTEIVDVGFYVTPYTPGVTIRNALTGIYQNYKVGRREEDLFYKVVMATGEGRDGKLSQEPNQLFYDYPEQYERHWGASVSEETKSAWYEKMRKMEAKLAADA